MNHPNPQYAPPPGGAPPAQVPPKKPIYKKVWFWLLVGLGLIIVIAALSGGDGDAPKVEPSSGQAIESTPVEAPAEPSAEAPTEPPAAVPDDDPLTDDDWTITEVMLNDSSGFGTAITARVTNNADSTRTALMTLTIFENGKMVTSTSGAANDVEAHSTATVTFIGTMDGELPANGNYTYELQVDF